MVNLLRVFILSGFIFYINSPSFALTIIPQPDGNYTIIDGVRIAKDLPEQTIIDNYNKYHSEYWMKVNSMLTNSKKYRWNRGIARGGNFR